MNKFGFTVIYLYSELSSSLYSESELRFVLLRTDVNSDERSG